jgi:hypothetical protein
MKTKAQAKKTEKLLLLVSVTWQISIPGLLIWLQLFA